MHVKSSRRLVRAMAAAVVLCLLSRDVAAQTSPAQDASTPPVIEAVGLWAEPRPVARAARLFDRLTGGREPGDGFFVDFGNMITGSGWISAGPGYRHHVLSRRAVVSTSAALSWRFYRMARASIDVPRLGNEHVAAGIEALYQDALQVNYFGLGNDSPSSGRTGYRLRTFDVNGHTTVTRGLLSVQARAGWLSSPDLKAMAGRLPAYPQTVDVFDEATAPGLLAPTSFAHGDVSATADLRDHRGRPTSGGLYRASASRYLDLDAGTSTFELFEVEGAQYLPVVGKTWVVALHAWGAFTRAAADQHVPFYLMPNIGGKNTVRGYSDYRFSGPQMEVVSAESRLALFNHVDAAVFADAGRVALRVRDLGLSALKTSVGVGVRFHADSAAVARLDVARSAEGWQLVFKMTEPFTRKTIAGRRTTTVPFVP